MKYKVMHLEQSGDRHGGKYTLYLLPKGPGTEDFIVVYPKGLERGIKKLIIEYPARIKGYIGLDSDAVEQVRDNFKEKTDIVLNRKKGRGSNLFTSGVIIGVFGLLNWFIPDPVPLVDELGLTLLGAALALYGVNLRRKGYKVSGRRAEIATRDISAMEYEDDPLLSRIFKSIQTQHDPLPRGTLQEEGEVDPIEAESLWLAQYGDMETLVSVEGYSRKELESFIRMLDELMSMDTLAALDRDNTRFNLHRKIRKKKKLQQTIGLSRESIDVYLAFYRSIEDFLAL